MLRYDSKKGASAGACAQMEGRAERRIFALLVLLDYVAAHGLDSLHLLIVPTPVIAN